MSDDLSERERAHREQMLRHASKYRDKLERKEKENASQIEKELRDALQKNFIKRKR